MKHLFAVIFVMATLVVISWTDGLAEEIDQRRPTTDPVSRLCMQPWKGDFARPEDANLPADEVYFQNAAGFKLRGWLFEAQDARQSILFCMGNSGNISLMLPYAKILQDAGFEVLLFDYQGFGNSEGTAGITSLVTDSLAAFDFLVQSRGRDPKDIGIFGVSLGSVLALTVAAERHAGAVAVEDAFIPDEQIDRLSRRYISQDNAVAQFALASVKSLLLGRVAPLQNVTRLNNAPVFLMHGVNDRLLPPSGTLRIAQACTGPKRVWLMESTGHAPESLEINDQEYASQLQSFFQEAFAGKFTEDRLSTQNKPKQDGTFSETVSWANTAPNARSSQTQPEPWQIAFADDKGNFHFEHRQTHRRSFKVTLNFKPEHVYAVRIYHAKSIANEQWIPKLSEFSGALDQFRVCAHELFRGERMCEHFWMWEGMNFYNYSEYLPKYSQLLAIRVLNELPQPDSIPERIRARYASLLARLHCWPKPNADIQHELQFGETMLKYLPQKPDDYYELGNARFQLKFRDSVVGDSLFRLAKARLLVGDSEAARRLLRMHMSVLPEHVPTNLTEERIASIQTLEDLIGKPSSNQPEH
ncbi:MAG: alpha/beta hydrolase [Fuerstiella sp.]